MSSSIPHHDARPVATAVAVLDDRLVVNLIDGRELRVPLSWFGWLDDATPEQKQDVRLIEGGRGIWWESVDEGVSVPWLFGLPLH
jgi:Protein of unknown function (DUF2442)